jgi:hypothetical protein
VYIITRIKHDKTNKKVLSEIYLLGNLFYLKYTNWKFVLKVLVGTGRYWSVLVGTGRYWSVLVGTGRYWSVLVVPKISNRNISYLEIRELDIVENK